MSALPAADDILVPAGWFDEHIADALESEHLTSGAAGRQRGSEGGARVRGALPMQAAGGGVWVQNRKERGRRPPSRAPQGRVVDTFEKRAF